MVCSLPLRLYHPPARTLLPFSLVTPHCLRNSICIIFGSPSSCLYRQHLISFQCWLIHFYSFLHFFLPALFLSLCNPSIHPLSHQSDSTLILHFFASRPLFHFVLFFSKTPSLSLPPTIVLHLSFFPACTLVLLLCTQCTADPFFYH